MPTDVVARLIETTKRHMARYIWGALVAIAQSQSTAMNAMTTLPPSSGDEIVKYAPRFVHALLVLWVAGSIPAYATGIAVCIGLNTIDPAHYAGSDGKLVACENDARDLLAIAQQSGFAGKTLLTQMATRDAVLSEMRQAAVTLKQGDIFMLTYSGHGGTIPDANANPADNGVDQTWCLYDGELLDKELYAEFAKFAAGVRILVISDSCHSEGITKMKGEDFLLGRPQLNGPAEPDKAVVERASQLTKAFEAAANTGLSKAISPGIAIATYSREQQRYDKIVADAHKSQPAQPIRPWVLSMSACANDELASDGRFNGVFTAAIKAVWNSSAFQGSYVAFHQQVADKAFASNPGQHAQRRMIDQQSQAYWNQRPFTVAVP